MCALLTADAWDAQADGLVVPSLVGDLPQRDLHLDKLVIVAQEGRALSSAMPDELLERHKRLLDVFWVDGALLEVLGSDTGLRHSDAIWTV